MAQDILQKSKEVYEKKIEVLKKRQGKEKEDKHYDTNRITNQVPISLYNILHSNINSKQNNPFYTMIRFLATFKS